MAETFACSFAGVFSRVVPVNPFPHQVSSSRMDELHFTAQDVFSLLTQLDPNTSMGCDLIHPRFLKSLASDLCIPLYLIFKTSLGEGALPPEWLMSVVVPIFKKGSRFDPLNYRPISLTSLPCKVMERLIVRGLMDHLETNDLLSDKQFGFRKSISTIDQLILTYNNVTKYVDSRELCDMIFLDYSKAFDKVCHPLLLEKLYLIGIHPSVVSWLSVS